MDQNNINQEEWSNPKNWSCFAYRSARDSRMLVPKRWGFGWTINFGNRKGAWLFVALLTIPIISVAALFISRLIHAHK